MINGSGTAGLESADPGGPSDSGHGYATRVERQLDTLAQAKEILLEWAEQGAAQEIDDAVCRIVTEAARQIGERKRGREAVHGLDQEETPLIDSSGSGLS